MQMRQLRIEAARPVTENAGFSPEIVKPTCSRACVMRRMSRVAMPKVILNQAKVMPPVSQSKTAGMAKHMRINVPETGPFTRGRNDVVHSLPGERGDRPVSVFHFREW